MQNVQTYLSVPKTYTNALQQPRSTTHNVIPDYYTVDTRTQPIERFSGCNALQAFMSLC